MVNKYELFTTFIAFGCHFLVIDPSFNTTLWNKKTPEEILPAQKTQLINV